MEYHGRQRETRKYIIEFPENLEIVFESDMGMNIEKASKSNLDELTTLALKLWPDNSWEHLKSEFAELLESEKDIVYIATVKDSIVGFIQMSIRYDYVEGSKTSPVGYIEGIYVDQLHRKKGISRQLVEAGERWAKSFGCSEIASDTEMENIDSQRFHKQIGFREAGRIVCFIKEIR